MTEFRRKMFHFGYAIALIYIMTFIPKSIMASNIISGKVIGVGGTDIQNLNSDSTTALKDRNVEVVDGKVKLNGKIDYNKEEIIFSLKGNTLPIEKSADGDRLLFGDLEVDLGKEKIDFIQLKIESESKQPKAKLLLEHSNTKEVLVYQFNIDSMLLKKLKKVAEINSEHLNSEELKNKTIKLDRAQKNKVNRMSNPEREMTVTEGEGYEKSIKSSPIIDPVNRKELKRLISDLEESGYGKWIDFSDYSLPKSLVSTEGYFKHIETDSTINGGNYLYGNAYKDPFGVTLVGISTFQSSGSEYENPNRAVLQRTLTDAITLKYDSETDKVQLYLKNRGVKNHKMRLTLGKLSKDDVFVNQTTNGQLNSPSGGSTEFVFNVLATIVPYGDTVLSVWDGLKLINKENPRDLGQTYFYPSDIEAQKKNSIIK